MIQTLTTLRPILVEILIGMGEVKPQSGASLIESPDSDMDLTQLKFDSLTMLDFCLKVETQTEIIIDPDELLRLSSLSALEALLLGKQAS
jgi:acyl carrier protein